MTDDSKELSAKQEKFVEEYLQCWNAAEAAKRAGYSEKTARQQGSRLLSNANISTHIQQRLAESAMSADEVLARLAKQARASLNDVFTLKPGIGMPYIDWQKAIDTGVVDCIKKVSIEPDKITVELYDVQSALVTIGKYHKLFIERHEHTGEDGAPIPLAVMVTKMRVDEL